jgi:CelD/BcsL family acetyltransferase involved in cellulose biosynthesis
MADAHMDLQDSTMRSVLAGQSPDAAAVQGLPLGSRLSVTTGAAGFMALEAQWLELEASCQSSRAVFQTFGWLSSWIEINKAFLPPDAIQIVTGFRNDRLVFAWPLMKAKAGPFTVLRWLSEPKSQYGDVLLASGECPNAWMGAAMELIRRVPGVDAIRLRHVRSDAAAALFLKQAFRDARLHEQASCLDLTRFADEAAYDARYTPAQRKRRKKIRKALEDGLGPLSFTILKPGPATDAAIDAAIAEKCLWIDARGRQNRVLSCPTLGSFMKHLARNRSAGTELVLSALSAGGREVSWEIGLRHNGTHFAFITSHVNALTDYSPARLHMDLSQRQALKDGMKAFDLMHPNDVHKESWSSGKTEVSDYYLPLSAKGAAYGAIYLERLRPRLRDAYYRMPPGLLKLLKPIIRH